MVDLAGYESLRQSSDAVVEFVITWLSVGSHPRSYTHYRLGTRTIHSGAGSVM